MRELFQGRKARWAGWFLITAMVGWFVFRTVACIAEEPHVDFQAFYHAGWAVVTGQDIFRAGEEMYIYPPMLAAWFSPLARLPLRLAAWLWLGLALGVTLVTVRWVWSLVCDRLALSDVRRAWPLGVGLAFLLWNNPIRWEFEGGQCDWLLLATMLLALAALDRAPWITGLALGFAINIKYLALALVVYLVFRLRWRAVAWTLAGTLGWALAPALVLGWNTNLQYLAGATAGLGKLIGWHVQHTPGQLFPITYDRSISLPSGAARLVEHGRLGGGTFAAIVAAEALLAALAGWAIYRRWRLPLFGGTERIAEALETSGPLPGQANGRQTVLLLEWLGAMTLMLAFSPQTSVRHLYLQVPVILLGVALVMGAATQRPRWLAALALAVGCLGVAIPSGPPVPNQVDWRFIGGRAASFLTMYLLLLAASLANVRARGHFRLTLPVRDSTPGQLGTAA